MVKKHNYSVVILAAGLSERMEEPKIFIKWNNLTFIENIIEGYIKFGCNDIIVVLNERDNPQFEELNIKDTGVKTVINEHIEWGRFYSLKLGLSALTSLQNCFVNNVDNPFVDFEVLYAMSHLVNDENVVVPVWKNKKGHPVLIGKNVIENIIGEADFSLNMKLFLERFKCELCVVESERILVNINTKEDFQKVLLKFKKFK